MPTHVSTVDKRILHRCAAAPSVAVGRATLLRDKDIEMAAAIYEWECSTRTLPKQHSHVDPVQGDIAAFSFWWSELAHENSAVGVVLEPYIANTS